MILWVVVFILVIAAAFILALQSMRDYQEIPESDGYSLFLIRKTVNLTKELLDSLQISLVDGKILSFERLVKGGQSALCVYGPQNILLKHKEDLDLMELEDYTKVNPKLISAWEIGIKGNKKLENEQTIFQTLSQFHQTEQFWWQIILSGKKDNSFNCQIRAILLCPDTQRRKHLTDNLHTLSGKFVKLPKAFSNLRMLEFYQQRSLRVDPTNLTLKSEEVRNLIIL